VSEATFAAIIEAAVQLFGEEGYASVRIDDIAAAAKVTRGAVYHHFKDKPGLFYAVLERVQARVGDAVADAADAVPDPWESFRAGCHAFLAAALDPAHRQIMLVDAPAVVGWEVWRTGDARNASSHLNEALANLQAAELIDVPSLGAAASMLSGAMNDAAVWVAERRGDAELTATYEMLDVLLSAIKRQT
jgi:AcrR family transcriptional regulator